MLSAIEPAFRDLMNRLAAALDEAFNGAKLPGIPRKPQVGFVLLTFNFGQIDNGRVNYISNADRADMITAMKEFIARAEGRVTADQPGVQ